MPDPSDISPQHAAQILSASNVSARAARAICLGLGLGGGSGDLRAVLAGIRARPDFASIELISQSMSVFENPRNHHSTYIFGMDNEDREYVIRTRPPRFVAELLSEPPEGLQPGLSMVMSDSTVVSNFAWIDPAPHQERLEAMREEIDEFLDEV